MGKKVRGQSGIMVIAAMNEQNKAKQQKQQQQKQMDTAMVRLLAHRYGDGLVYLREDGERLLLDKAMGLGFVSAEGYLTPKGRALLARCDYE